MKRCLLVGRTNTGKTLLLINFAAYLGASALRLGVAGGGPAAVETQLPLGRARAHLVNGRPYTTLTPVATLLRLSQGRTERLVRLVDSPALGDHVHPDAAVRAAMAASLQALRAADLVLHLVDAARAAERDEPAVGEVDRQIAAFARTADRPYAVLANKLDLPGGRAGLRRVRAAFPGRAVIGVSALRGGGFPHVRQFLAEHA